MTEAQQAKSPLRFVDEYCDRYQAIFPEVRSYEALRYLHVGMLSDVKRKSLPTIARVVGLPNNQPLEHFLTESPWEIEQFREQRLQVILDAIGEREIILIIDETGDRKKGGHALDMWIWPSKGSPKFIAIDQEAEHGIVHPNRLGETNRFPS